MSLNFCEVKGQGQNCCAEIFPIIIALSWFKMSTKFGILTDIGQPEVIYATADEAVAYMFYRCFFVFCFFFRPQKI